MSADPTIQDLGVLTLERRGHVLLMGLDRPEKRNAFNIELLHGARPRLRVARARRRAALRRALRARRALHRRPRSGRGRARARRRAISATPRTRRDPWRNDGRPWTKPGHSRRSGLVPDPRHRAAPGRRHPRGEQRRAASRRSRSSAASTRSAARPCGFPREAGWGNAMRWLLTGDEFDATEAHRIGLDAGDHRTRCAARPRGRARRGHRNPLSATGRADNAGLGPGALRRRGTRRQPRASTTTWSPSCRPRTAPRE